MSRELVWAQGQTPPADLPDGRYILRFEVGSSDLAERGYNGSKGAVGKALTVMGHTVQLDGCQQTGEWDEAANQLISDGGLEFTFELTGFPWEYLSLLAGAIGLVWLSFTKFAAIWREVVALSRTPLGWGLGLLLIVVIGVVLYIGGRAYVKSAIPIP